MDEDECRREGKRKLLAMPPLARVTAPEQQKQGFLNPFSFRIYLYV
jgi:hypothetical protein